MATINLNTPGTLGTIYTGNELRSLEEQRLAAQKEKQQMEALFGPPVELGAASTKNPSSQPTTPRVSPEEAADAFLNLLKEKGYASINMPAREELIKYTIENADELQKLADKMSSKSAIHGYCTSFGPATAASGIGGSIASTLLNPTMEPFLRALIISLSKAGGVFGSAGHAPAAFLSKQAQQGSFYFTDADGKAINPKAGDEQNFNPYYGSLCTASTGGAALGAASLAAFGPGSALLTAALFLIPFLSAAVPILPQISIRLDKIPGVGPYLPKIPLTHAAQSTMKNYTADRAAASRNAAEVINNATVTYHREPVEKTVKEMDKNGKEQEIQVLEIGFMVVDHGKSEYKIPISMRKDGSPYIRIEDQHEVGLVEAIEKSYIQVAIDYVKNLKSPSTSTILKIAAYTGAFTAGALAFTFLFPVIKAALVIKLGTVAASSLATLIAGIISGTAQTFSFLPNFIDAHAVGGKKFSEDPIGFTRRIIYNLIPASGLLTLLRQMIFDPKKPDNKQAAADAYSQYAVAKTTLEALIKQAFPDTYNEKNGTFNYDMLVKQIEEDQKNPEFMDSFSALNQLVENFTDKDLEEIFTFNQQDIEAVRENMDPLKEVLNEQPKVANQLLEIEPHSTNLRKALDTQNRRIERISKQLENQRLYNEKQKLGDLEDAVNNAEKNLQQAKADLEYARKALEENSKKPIRNQDPTHMNKCNDNIKLVITAENALKRAQDNLNKYNLSQQASANQTSNDASAISTSASLPSSAAIGDQNKPQLYDTNDLSKINSNTTTTNSSNIEYELEKSPTIVTYRFPNKGITTPTSTPTPTSTATQPSLVNSSKTSLVNSSKTEDDRNLVLAFNEDDSLSLDATKNGLNVPVAIIDVPKNEPTTAKTTPQSTKKPNILDRAANVVSDRVTKTASDARKTVTTAANKIENGLTTAASDVKNGLTRVADTITNPFKGFNPFSSKSTKKTTPNNVTLVSNKNIPPDPKTIDPEITVF